MAPANEHGTTCLPMDGEVLPAPDFNRLAERTQTSGGALQLNFYARPAADDRWSPWRGGPEAVRRALLVLVAAMPEGSLPART